MTAGRIPQHTRILIGMAVGAALGLLARTAWPPTGDQADPRLAWVVYAIAEPLGQIFLRLIFMIVLPLLFCALVIGVTGSGDLRRLGKMGLATLVFTILLSAASVGIGVLAANVLRPGDRLDPAQRTILRERYAQQVSEVTGPGLGGRRIRDTLLDIIPRNPFKDAVQALDGGASGGILAVMFFALAVGLAMLYSPERTGPLLRVIEGLYDVSMAIVSFAMRLAPFGVAGLMFALTGLLGAGILAVLVGYVATVIAGLLLHGIGVYSLVVGVFAKRRPLAFFRGIAEAVLTGFATSSSNATLPTSIRVAEERLGLRREVAGFVLTVGSTANQNGTALYEGVTVLFLAQAFGVDLSVGQQLIVAGMCILAGIGTAGVPGGSLPFVALVLGSVGVPVEGIGIIIGVDRLLDMCRTALNVAGDLVIAACVDRWAAAAPTSGE